MNKAQYIIDQDLENIYPFIPEALKVRESKWAWHIVLAKDDNVGLSLGTFSSEAEAYAAIAKCHIQEGVIVVPGYSNSSYGSFSW